MAEEADLAGLVGGPPAWHSVLRPTIAWSRKMEAGALTAVGSEEVLVPELELKKANERIRRLERILGMKPEEVEVLKEAVRIGREKNSSRESH